MEGVENTKPHRPRWGNVVHEIASRGGNFRQSHPTAAKKARQSRKGEVCLFLRARASKRTRQPLAFYREKRFELTI